MGRIDHPVGTCIDCGLKDTILISKRCYIQPSFCYQRYKESRQREKIKDPKKNISIRRIASKSKNDIPALIDKAVMAFHSWIKRRDCFNRVFKCISCGGLFLDEQAQCGHYLPAGNNAGVRFDERCANAQCGCCNVTLNGNQANYRVGLIKKIGLQEVEALELKAKQFFKWDRSYLIDIINKYKK